MFLRAFALRVLHMGKIQFWWEFIEFHERQTNARHTQDYWAFNTKPSLNRAYDDSDADDDDVNNNIRQKHNELWVCG